MSLLFRVSRRALLFSIPLPVLVMVVSACTDATLPAGPRPTELPRDSLAQRVEGRLPENFPADFPIYTDATVEKVDISSNGFIADLRTTDSVGMVAAFYKEKLALAPWQTLAIEEPDPSILKLDFAGGGGVGYTGAVGVSKIGGDLTRIQVHLRPNAQ